MCYKRTFFSGDEAIHRPWITIEYLNKGLGVSIVVAVLVLARGLALRRGHPHVGRARVEHHLFHKPF